VLDLVRRKPGTSWVEVCREIPGAKGDRAITGSLKNVFIWDGVSQELIDAFNQLLKAELVDWVPCSTLVYIVDGEIPRLPVVKSVRKNGYAKPHWLPTALNIPKTKQTKASS
jgi:hypothetical protein